MNRILLGKGEQPVYLHSKYGTRHGLVAGATGTGKTVSLMVIAEGFSRLGVPVFLADVKGDVAGLAMPGSAGDKILERARTIGVEGYAQEANPVVFWDLYGKSGHPVRTTISELGPTLLSRILDLSEAQVGALEIAFALADDRGLLLLDLDDLRALLGFVAENRKDISAQYGLVSAQSVAAIQRGLLSLERQGGDTLFGEPALELADLMRVDLGGRGIINVLAADRLVLEPRLFSSFLLWLLSELFENLPEVGDLDKPKLVFMFDEAHLLFDDAPAALRDRVEQVVRIIRSKGVGVYFCSQFPDDVPGEILGQLGNRVQHALRAFTPRDQKAVRTAAETFVPNPQLDVARAISALAVGEALVSTLQEGGVPMPVQRTLMAPPRSRIGAITSEERASVRARSPIGAKYDTAVNRESAYEMLRGAIGAPGATRGTDATGATGAAETPSKVDEFLWGTKRRQGMVETMAKQTARTVGSQLGRQILRGILGGILGVEARAMTQIFVYGDSLSWGIIPGTRRRLLFRQRWPGVLEASLADSGHPVRVIEDCLNGRRTVWDDPFKPGRNGLAGLEQRMEIHSPLALVILMLGTNDFQSVHQHNASHSAQGVASLVRAMRRAPIEPDMPVPPILVVAPPRPGAATGTMAEKFAGAREKSDGIGAAYASVAADLGCAFFDAGRVITVSQVDGVHLDADQHEILGKAIVDPVRTLL